MAGSAAAATDRPVAAGAHAALIGEALMRATDPRALLESFLTIAEKAK